MKHTGKDWGSETGKGRWPTEGVLINQVPL